MFDYFFQNYEYHVLSSVEWQIYKRQRRKQTSETESSFIILWLCVGFELMDPEGWEGVFGWECNCQCVTVELVSSVYTHSLHWICTKQPKNWSAKTTFSLFWKEKIILILLCCGKNHFFVFFVFGGLECVGQPLFWLCRPFLYFWEISGFEFEPRVLP